MRLLLITLCVIMALPAVAMDRMTLLLDWFINPDHGPIIIAREKGYFAEQGLEIEIVPPADPSTPARLVAAGQADLAVSYQTQLHLDVHQGLPLIRVGTLVATPLNCLLVLRDGPITTPADLAGRKIGFSLTGVQEAVLAAMLGKYGVTEEDVELVNINFSISPSLMSGQVDAVIGAFRNFELNQMDIEGIPGKCFYPEEEGVPPYDELIYVAHPERMNPEKISRFLVATELATQYIINNPEAAWDIFSGTSPELQDELNIRAWADTLPRFALRPAAVDHGRYAAFEDFLLNQGLISSRNPASSIVVDVTAR
ncbi:MAG: ABC transporter substrate-binding protein [Rhodobacteraceae bacterium]|nr:ABC transporter substrate-binding protein [Paracoccaceae bacterium]